MNLETLSQWLRASPASRERALAACLDRIRILDDSIRAWVQVSPQPPLGSGSLSGIPFGAKDIFETRGLSTEYGSPVYRGRIGTADAALVAELRSRGAVLLGKTHTTAFAYVTPAPTRNPRDLAHTPGGSSSGSAAAVAAGMVPLALGTQTKGSVLRPASYCGITGFKPSYGLFSMEGILPIAESLDTIGFFTHSPADMQALWDSLGRQTGSSERCALGVPDPMPAIEPAMLTAFQRALSELRRAGESIRAVELGDMLPRLAEAAHLVMFYEGARAHRDRYQEHGTMLADMADLVRAGLQIPQQQYDEARRYIDECRLRIAEVYEATPVLLVPAATGPAPRGLASTGDPRMNAPWTALGTPAISIPMPVEGLPLGLQLTATHGQDGSLLGTAVRMSRVLSSVQRVDV